MIKKYLKLFFIVSFISSSLAAFSFAITINPTIINDLSSVSGYIVKKQSQNVFIIDLDATDGIMTGDLFSVITEKESLTHPITEHVIGKLDQVKAILRVTQVKKGYAYTSVVKVIEKNSVILPGDNVKRYNQMKTQFIDQTGNGKHIFTVLMKNLSHCSWKPYARVPESDKNLQNRVMLSDLNIFFHKKGIEIKDMKGNLIHFYPTQNLYLPKSEPLTQSLIPYPSFEMAGTSRISPSLKTLGKIDGLIQSADFIIDNDQLVMAVADHKRIAIFHIGNHMTKVCELESPIQYQPLYLNWWRPDTVSPPHLTVTFWNNQDIESKIFVFKNKSLKTLAYGINYHLSSYDKNLDGNPETLLGQSMDRETFWNRRTYQLVYFDRALRLSRRLRLPASFTVYGSIMGDMTGEGYLETVWIRNGILRIYQGKSFLYKTYVGDFPNQRITYDIDPVAKKTLFRDVSIYPKPVFYDMNKDQQPELFVIHSERPFLNRLGFSGQAVRTWIKCIRYHNKMFYSQRVSNVFDSNIQAIKLFKDKFIILMSIADHETDLQSYTKVVTWPLNKD